MASSKATTVAAYLKELPAERRAVVAAVREVVLKNLPEGYVEQMSYGMIGYDVPLARYPETYNGRPLTYAGLAAQKNHYSLYLTCVNCSEEQASWLREAFAKAGKKLDMGKACIRFRQLEDLPLDVVGRAIARVGVAAFIQGYEAARKGR